MAGTRRRRNSAGDSDGFAQLNRREAETQGDLLDESVVIGVRGTMALFNLK